MFALPFFYQYFFFNYSLPHSPLPLFPFFCFFADNFSEPMSGGVATHHTQLLRELTD
jgi:hypothetical protein